MRSKIFLLLLFCVAILLSGCHMGGGSSGGSTDGGSTDGGSTDGGSTDGGSTDGGGVDAEDLAYQSIDRYLPTAATENKLSFRASSKILRLTLPSEWVLTEEADGDGYTITRDGNAVGRIYSGRNADFSEWKKVDGDSRDEDGVLSQMAIERKGAGETLCFRYRFSYEFGDESNYYFLTLTADCKEISESTAEYLLAASLSDARDEVGMGILSLPDGEPKSVLLLGNSFISSSSVGSILQEMMYLGGKSCEVRAVSRGYATVNTYINDKVMMNNICSGVYDVVFISGFYSWGEVANLGVLKAACDASNTPLVIFPAHNENASVVKSAATTYPTLTLLDWKSEIDALIAYRGLSKWDFCVDDAHDHSTAPAGYVGAHMIYRALYNEMPVGEVSQSIPQAAIDYLIDSYVTDGYAGGERNDVKYFN